MGDMQLFNKLLKTYIVPGFKLSIYSAACKLKPTPYVQYHNCMFGFSLAYEMITFTQQKCI